MTEIGSSGAPYEASYGAAQDARRQAQLDRIDAMRERNVLPAAQLDAARAVVLLGSDTPLGELLTLRLLERLVDAFEERDGYLRHLRGAALLRSWDRTPSLAVRTGYALRLLTKCARPTGPCRTRPATRCARTPVRRPVLTTPAPCNAPPTGGTAVSVLSTAAPP